MLRALSATSPPWIAAGGICTPCRGQLFADGRGKFAAAYPIGQAIDDILRGQPVVVAFLIFQVRAAAQASGRR